MKLLLSLSFLFISFNIFGQEVKIDTIRIELSDKLTSGFEENNYYPLIKTGNKKIDSLINYDLKNKLTREEMPNISIDSTLNEWASYGLVFLDFQINYNKNRILSLRIDAEGCGAYCTNWTEFYNYSTDTGKALKLSDIVDLTYLKDDILKKKNKQYQLNREELKKQLDEDEGLDLSTYQFILERYNECDKSFEINQFALYEDHLEIIEGCNLPHAFKPSTPIIDIQYDLSDIKEHLKIKN
ncbi:hypothetical protein GCM10023115_24830 [Pontixanthobacter gangjinensis]|uniref:DUF4163 domain-containing protein n=1 Tax=Christiangramia aestuarii TaxID=1028746 RepID=A0A7K1LST8_9FLAO|nr:hypothetical protein [Christiangramia aestuarii]MUP43884.1 hypothetical protein [Christiangramia aestuarii]